MNPLLPNAWKLVSLSPLPAWALVALGALLCAGVILASFGIRREPKVARRVALWVLRAGAGLAGIFFLLEPGVRDLQVAQVKNRVAVLVDRSASMNFPVEPGGKLRTTQVADSIEAMAGSLGSLSERFLWSTTDLIPSYRRFQRRLCEQSQHTASAQTFFRP